MKLLRRFGHRARAREKGIREDLVRRVRAELAAGTYVTAEKWDAALDKLAGFLEAWKD